MINLVRTINFKPGVLEERTSRDLVMHLATMLAKATLKTTSLMVLAMVVVSVNRKLTASDLEEAAWCRPSRHFVNLAFRNCPGSG